MAVARQAAPIKFGVLTDMVIPKTPERDVWEDMVRPFELVFREGFEQGVLDRPVELVRREVEGLPRGTVKAVIDAYGELADEGCLAVFGPNISENTIPLRAEIERRFQVPAISLCGADDWLGEWTFALPAGSMTDEPILIAHLIARAGLQTAGVLVERSLIGQLYLRGFRDACRDAGIALVAEETIAQIDQDIEGAVRAIHKAKPDALVHLGFGFGVIRINEALRSCDWDPPRYMGTSFEDAYFSHEIWDAFVGWIGLEQYDEGNPVGQRFLDRYEAVYGDRPQYFAPVVSRDVAVSFLRAFADAQPLSPRGVMEA
ncbi:MAG TPA: ABC transporter substrate-binding protein, partial [Acidimicrobiia bacterium]|nr:ABC transporter substrate-binding protein [Acidimicrobiia bacterium]